MNCLVIGYGSIGARRAKILRELGCDVAIYDTAVHVTAAAEGEGFFVLHELADEAWQQHDATVIATPPETHARLAANGFEACIPMFIEKPLCLSHKDAGWFKRTATHWTGCGMHGMVACNLRFHPSVAALKDQIARDHFGDVYAYRFTLAHQLEAWRDGAERVYTNGVLLDGGIHELDLCRWFGGPVVRSHTETVSDRVAAITACHESGTVSSLHLDARCPTYRRTVEVFGTKGYTSVLIDPDPTMYEYEMQHFVDCVRKRIPTVNPIEDAAVTMRWALELQEQP